MVTPRIGVSVDIERTRQTLNVSLLALSEATGIPRSSLKRKLANPGTFTLDQYVSVCTVLNISTWATA